MYCLQMCIVLTGTTLGLYYLHLGQFIVPVAETELHHSNPYELLVAVILPAQCTDKRVNMITPALFEAFPTPEVMAASSHEVVFDYIGSHIVTGKQIGRAHV